MTRDRNHSSKNAYKLMFQWKGWQKVPFGMIDWYQLIYFTPYFNELVNILPNRRPRKNLLHIIDIWKKYTFPFIAQWLLFILVESVPLSSDINQNLVRKMTFFTKSCFNIWVEIPWAYYSEYRIVPSPSL